EQGWWVVGGGGRREEEGGGAGGLEGGQCGFEKQPTDAVPAMGRVDHNVVEDPRRPAQRHVLGPLDAGIGVAEHLAGPPCDEQDDARLTDLPPDKGSVSVLCP